MAGEARMTSRRWRRLALAALPALGAMAAVFPAPASAVTLTAHTNRGGTCHLRTIASRTGSQINYGIKVSDCSTRFGVRYADSLGILYDQTNQKLPVKNGYLGRKKGDLPYVNRRSVSGTDPSHTYRTRVDITIVLKGLRNADTRRIERWQDPGKGCHVKSTRHNGDTLGCSLNDTL